MPKDGFLLLPEMMGFEENGTDSSLGKVHGFQDSHLVSFSVDAEKINRISTKVPFYYGLHRHTGNGNLNHVRGILDKTLDMISVEGGFSQEIELGLERKRVQKMVCDGIKREARLAG